MWLMWKPEGEGGDVGIMVEGEGEGEHHDAPAVWTSVS